MANSKPIEQVDPDQPGYAYRETDKVVVTLTDATGAFTGQSVLTDISELRKLLGPADLFDTAAPGATPGALNQRYWHLREPKAGTPTRADLYVYALTNNALGWGTPRIVGFVLDATAPSTAPAVSLALSATTATPGQAITLTATPSGVNQPFSKVEFFADGATTPTATATAAPWQATYSSSVLGAHTLVAVVTDSLNVTATSSTKTLTVAAASLPVPVISFPAIGNKTVGDLPNALNASSTNAVTPITYTSSNQNVLEVRLDPAGWVAEPLTAGTARVTASQAAGNGYAAATPASQQVTVSAVATPVTTPGAPTIGTTTIGDGQLTANWQAPASDGGAAISAYKVYRDGAAGALAIIGNVLSYLDRALKNGDSHIYQVSAVNSAGEGPKSAASTGVTARPTDGWVVLNDSARESSGVVFSPASTQRFRFAGNPNTAGAYAALQITDSSDSSVSYVSIPDDYKNQLFAFDRADGTTYTATFPSPLTDYNFTA